MARKTIVTGRTAVITGAASGIGRALDRAAGPRTAAPSWPATGTRTAWPRPPTSIGGTVLPAQARRSRPPGRMAFAADVQRVGAARRSGWSSTTPASPSRSRRSTPRPRTTTGCSTSTSTASLHGTRAFLPILREQDAGAIVNVSSIFGIIGWPTQSAYCASKFAVRGYTESLRHELRDTDVRAVTVHPGGIATNIVKQLTPPRRRPGPHRQGGAAEGLREGRRARRPRRRPRRSTRGVEAGKDRILIGPDAWARRAGCSRLVPVRYFDVIKASGAGRPAMMRR